MQFHAEKLSLAVFWACLWSDSYFTPCPKEQSFIYIYIIYIYIYTYIPSFSHEKKMVIHGEVPVLGQSYLWSQGGATQHQTWPWTVLDPGKFADGPQYNEIWHPWTQQQKTQGVQVYSKYCKMDQGRLKTSRRILSSDSWWKTSPWQPDAVLYEESWLNSAHEFGPVLDTLRRKQWELVMPL